MEMTIVCKKEHTEATMAKRANVVLQVRTKKQATINSHGDR